MTLRTLQEINNAFMAENENKPKQESAKKKSVTRAALAKKKNRTAFAAFADMLFYFAILAVLFSVLSPGPDSGKPKSILGYSYFTVISNSMKDEIPKGSFVLVRETAPHKLAEGDNITFMRDRYDSVTHKIISIYENYDNSGARGFATMGTNNANPDSDIVYEANVIGKVILVIPKLGAAISYLGANIHVVFIFFAICILASFVIRGVFARPNGKKEAIELETSSNSSGMRQPLPTAPKPRKMHDMAIPLNGYFVPFEERDGHKHEAK